MRMTSVCTRSGWSPNPGALTCSAGMWQWLLVGYMMQGYNYVEMYNLNWRNNYTIQVAELASLAQLLPPRSPTVHNPAPDSSLCRLQSCSPIASASAAARRLHPLQLLLLGQITASASTAAPPLPPLPAAAPASSAACRLHPLQLLLPDCVCFNCCSPITSASTAAPRMRLLNSSPCPNPKFSNILRGVRGSVNKLKYEGRASL